MVKIFNSLTNKLEEFKPLEEGKVSLYVCGPTVYSYPHVGNFRPVITFDVLVRLFRKLGYEVTYISNITDIDDKIINQAIKENVSEKEIATKYETNFFDVQKELNCVRPTYTPHATTTIPHMIKFIEQLIKEGYAYEVDGDVFFRVKKINDYGILNHFNPDDLQSGARIEENNKKEDPLDFALWKNTDVGIKFDAPFGLGRPGWHTECVCMIQDYYPDARIDIHGGGFDLKFPHHENEIAQANAIYHHHIANYWMHNGFINLGDEKMSKSLGNVIYGKDLVKQYGGNVVRMVMLEGHYRAPLNFASDQLVNAQNDLNKIFSALKNASINLQINSIDSKESSKDLINKFLDELSVDLNTSNGLTIIYGAIKDMNNALRSKDYNTLSVLFNSVLEMIDVLGLKYEDVKLSNEDKELFNKWNEYRLNKDFANADIIRNKLSEKGLI